MHPAVIVEHSLGVLMRCRRCQHGEFVVEAGCRPGAKRKRCTWCKDTIQVRQGDQPPRYRTRRFSQTNKHRSIPKRYSPPYCEMRTCAKFLSIGEPEL